MVALNKIKESKTIQELLEFGIISIDKPSNPTSFDVSDFVRKKLKLRKASHFGTLDPKVTGVLPIALNRACKLTGFFLGEDKEYVGIMRLHKEVSLEDLNKVIKEKFTGKIKQTPPKRSRVKRQERERSINRFELIEKAGKDVVFISDVQGGTYIRKLIDDLGSELGIGAHMLELRRIRAGIFKEEKSVNLYDFDKAIEEFEIGNGKLLREIIIPAEIVSEVYPAIQVKEKCLDRLFTGKPIHKSDLLGKPVLEKENRVSVFSGERFIGMYKVVNEGEIIAKSEFVLQPIKN